MSQLEFLKHKITSPEDLPKLIARWRVKGHKVVFTNGVFDIIHKGHITLLAAAADMGDKLILGLNSDQSVRTLGKGPDRPINRGEDRAFVLAGLASVAAIVVFYEGTPYELIKKIEPDVLVKGGDYDPHQTDPEAKNYIVGSDIQESNGKETVAIPIVDGYSSTSIIRKINHG
ncbi:MAG: adenylyltransferase/cytidyltransferase family protein [Flavobacteriales bacterium]|nr:adenylyltransferase/cytidyltransferase family protein [Flavobacteriales bacterium]